jgi:hypothetical protein
MAFDEKQNATDGGRRLAGALLLSFQIRFRFIFSISFSCSLSFGAIEGGAKGDRDRAPS